MLFFVILGSQIKYCVLLLAVGIHHFVQQTGATASASGEILRGRIGKGWEKSLFQHKKFDPIFDSDGRQSVDILLKGRKMSKPIYHWLQFFQKKTNGIFYLIVC